jgi:hypothetical protein
MQRTTTQRQAKMLHACRQALLSCALARDMLIFGNTQETVCRLGPPRALLVVFPNSPSAKVGILLKAAPRKAVPVSVL